MSSEPLASDPRNHCVPIFDVLDVPATETDRAERLLVMPLLRRFDDPSFETFGEAMAFFVQMIEVNPSTDSPVCS